MRKVGRVLYFFTKENLVKFKGKCIKVFVFRYRGAKTENIEKNRTSQDGVEVKYDGRDSGGFQQREPGGLQQYSAGHQWC